MALMTFEKHASFPLSEHFDVREFHCRCKHVDCVTTLIDMALIEMLEEIHRLLDEAVGHVYPLFVKSGYRCEKHNLETPDAVPGSQHPQGTAADIVVPNKYHRLVEMLVGDRGGVGFYNDRLHVDVRGVRARWGK